MSYKRVFLKICAVLLLAACGGDGPEIPLLPQDSFAPVTLTPLPTPTTEPTATSIPAGAEGIGLAFFRAWEGKDYLGMYSLLSAQSQALVDSRTFVEFYREIMEVATVQAIHIQPLSARQDAERAEFGVRVTWDTSAVGKLTRDHEAELVFSNGRWGIVWDETLVLPELEGGYELAMDHRIPARANIYDINGQALAFQGNVITLGVIPGQIEDEDGLLNALSPLLNLSPEEIQLLYASALPDWYVPIGDVREDLAQENFGQLEPYFNAGLVTDSRLTRLYLPGGIAPHVVGYTGFIPAEEIDRYVSQGYRGDEQVGLTGIELWGEDYLNGERGGVLSIAGPNGEYISTVQEREPKQARSIFSSLDADLQVGVEQALAEAIESHPLGHAGSIIVMDVDSGAIRAMASYPTYDPVVFDTLRFDGDAGLLAVLNDPGRPLVNRAAQGEYPPGSIFKIVTFTAGVNSGQYTPETRYTSTGSWNRLGDTFIKYDWREGGHGTVSLSQALVVSCNSCFYDVGYNLDQVDSFIIPETARQFGLGEPTGVVGIFENEGLIPDPEWKLSNVGEGWVPGDSVNMAIGQGFVEVSPLQMVRLIAAVANDGTLNRPTVIDRIGAGGGAPEEQMPAEPQGSLPLSDENLAVIRNSLRDVASSPSGTATHRFQRLAVPVAGKTGTAETVIGEPHAWFIGYAPAEPYTLLDGTVIEEPEIAVVVMIENSGEGSAVAAPIFRRVIELYYGLTPLSPYPW